MPLGREVWPDAALLHKHPPERAFQSDQLLPRRGQLVPKLAPPGSSVHLADRAGEEAAEAVLDRTALRVLELKEREVLLRLLLDPPGTWNGGHGRALRKVLWLPA